MDVKIQTGNALDDIKVFINDNQVLRVIEFNVGTEKNLNIVTIKFIPDNLTISD